MSQQEDLRARLMGIFRVEADEHLQIITTDLRTLEQPQPDSERRARAEAIFREVHTLKGAARSVGLHDVESLCQACEAALSRMTRGELSFESAIVLDLRAAMSLVAALVSGEQRAIDEVVTRLKQSAEGGLAPSPLGPAQPVTPGPAQFEPTPPSTVQAPDVVRLASARLDALVLQAEDLLGPKLAAELRAQESQALVEGFARLRQPRPGTEPSGRRAALLSAELDAELRALEAQATELARRLAMDEQAASGIVGQLLGDVRRLRMMPAWRILDPFPTMVADLAGAQAKAVEWITHGVEVEMDRRILDAVKDPLIHLVRNAIAHGIEPAEQRSTLGKSRAGRVELSLTPQEGGMIEIDVTDDGAGVDLSEVRAAAVRGRVLAPDAAEALDDEAALELIYRSGLSTSPLITELSGHGLGLPIVRERVEQLGGRVRVETASGQGTTVRLTVPSSMTAFRGLLVLAGVQVFLLPIESVQRAVRFSSSDVRTLGGREVLVSQGAAIPLAQLAVILGLDAGPGANGDQTCVLVASGGIVAAIIVDDLLGDREVLVKEFQAPLLRVHYVSAAGLLGTGELALILRPRDLVRAAEGRGTGRRGDSAPTEQIRQLAILVVDDSITTRTMEKTLLEAEGYRVRVAVDGLDAWTILKTEELDLVLSDVDMPRMDGLELTARIRADAQLADLPVVLVTALESREDKERGVEVGANAYVVKSSFDQANVLSTIRRLI